MPLPALPMGRVEVDAVELAVGELATGSTVACDTTRPLREVSAERPRLVQRLRTPVAYLYVVEVSDGAYTQVSWFVWRHPWWSGTAIAAVAILLAAGIPVVGGTLAVIVLLGGTVAELIVWNKTNATQQALQMTYPAPQLPPAPYRPPGVETRQTHYSVEQVPPVPAPVHGTQPPTTLPIPKMPPIGKGKSQRPSLAAIVSQLRVDETARELDEQVEVAGETYYSRQIKAVFRGAEMVIASGGGSTLRNKDCILVPDPWNEHDENAVAVFVDGEQVGHLPADLAQDYALPLRQIAERGLLVPGQARIWAKDDGGVIWARVTVLIPAAVDL